MVPQPDRAECERYAMVEVDGRHRMAIEITRWETYPECGWHVSEGTSWSLAHKFMTGTPSYRSMRRPETDLFPHTIIKDCESRSLRTDCMGDKDKNFNE
jgi:hypothetical protein